MNTAEIKLVLKNRIIDRYTTHTKSRVLVIGQAKCADKRQAAIAKCDTHKNMRVTVSLHEARRER